MRRQEQRTASGYGVRIVLERAGRDSSLRMARRNDSCREELKENRQVELTPCG